MGNQFPEGLRLRHTARGHDFFVKEMSWSPDGRMLAAPCDNGTIEVWNAESGLIIRRISIAAKGAFPATWISNDRVITLGPRGITPEQRLIDLNTISSYAVETGQREKLFGVPPTHV
jgi:WD40 repeat protein